MARAILRLTQVFDPSKTWQHLSQFESDYSAFLKTKGLEGEIVNLIGGQSGELFMLIQPITKLIPEGIKTFEEKRESSKVEEMMKNPTLNPKLKKGGTFSDKKPKEKKKIKLTFKKGRRISQRFAEAKLGGKK